MPNELVFVYGTLLEGLRNHRALKGADLFDTALTVDNFSMYAHLSFPAITLEPAYPIVGEVYSVDEQVLKRLDHLEGYDPEHPERSFYKRKYIKVKCANGSVYDALVYYVDTPPFDMKFLFEGDYRAYLKYAEN